MGAGRVVHLNGSSSAGKTSIAWELITQAPDMWIRLGIDTFLRAIDYRFNGGERSAEGLTWTHHEGVTEVSLGPMGRNVVDAMYASVAATANSGLNVVIDDVVLDQEWAAASRRGLAKLDVLTVGVHCPLVVLEEREAARGDRRPGLVRAQHAMVHRFMTYDLEVDSSQSTAAEIAARILERLQP